MEVKTAIRQRRSIRRFSAKPVAFEVLLELVELARFYASGGNLQPIRFSILSAQPFKDQLFHLLNWAAYLPEFYIPAEEQPPVYIILLWDTSVGQGCSFDVGAAATTLMLAAQERGLATCCVGNFSKSRLLALLSVPKKYSPELVIAIGYPAQTSTATNLTDSVRYSEDNRGNMLVPKYGVKDVLLELPPTPHSLQHGG